MAEENKRKAALAVYNTLCSALDHHEWHYKRDDEKLRITTGAQGDDLPMDLAIHVLEDKMLLMLLSKLPFTCPEDKRTDMAIAVSAINDRLASGCFDYDFRSGNCTFRLTNSFRESLLSEEFCNHMVMVSCFTIDEFNDKLFLLAKGMLSLEQFLEVIDN